MTRDQGLVNAFATYLRRVIGKTDDTVAILDASSDVQSLETTRVVIVVGGIDDGPSIELDDRTTATRRFADWSPGEPMERGGVPVAILDCWDPDSLPPTPDSFDVLALVTTFNEADIVEQLIRRLQRDLIRVHVVDNWSNDGTFELLEKFAAEGTITVERFPAEGPSGYFELEKLLQRVEDLAHVSGADWVVHHDADEIREPPWPGVSLRRGLFAVEQWGFNCVDHTVVNFRPVDNSWHDGDDLASSFPFFEFGDGPALFIQLKAWKPQPVQVVMARTGGHDAAFEGRRVFPYKFVTRHYPIRSQAHGERKILRERQSRWSPFERARGWHTHYDHYGEASSFIWDPAELARWEEVDRLYLLERLSGVGLRNNPWPGEAGPADPGGPFADSAYAASIKLGAGAAADCADLTRLAPGEIRALVAEVSNLGDQTWQRGGRNDVGLATKWFAGTSPDLAGPPLHEGARSYFMINVPPGDQVLQPFSVQAPLEPGDYTLLIDLVHERVRWFGCGIALRVKVGS